MRPSMLWPVLLVLKAMVSSRAAAEAAEHEHRDPGRHRRVGRRTVVGRLVGCRVVLRRLDRLGHGPHSTGASSPTPKPFFGTWATASVGRPPKNGRAAVRAPPGRTVRRVLLRAGCPGCGGPGPALRTGCAAALTPAPGLPPPAGVDACVALLAYEGPGRRLLARLKYAQRAGRPPEPGGGAGGRRRRPAPTWSRGCRTTAGAQARARLRPGRGARGGARAVSPPPAGCRAAASGGAAASPDRRPGALPAARASASAPPSLRRPRGRRGAPRGCCWSTTWSRPGRPRRPARHGPAGGPALADGEPRRGRGGPRSCARVGGGPILVH